MQTSTVGVEPWVALTQVTLPCPSSSQFETCAVDPGVTSTQLHETELSMQLET